MGSQATVFFESADAAVDTVLDFVNTRFDKLDEAVIPVLSLGATRRFLIRPRGGGPSKTIVAHGGDLGRHGRPLPEGLPALGPQAEAAHRSPPQPELLSTSPARMTVPGAQNPTGRHAARQQGPPRA